MNTGIDLVIKVLGVVAAIILAALLLVGISIKIYEFVMELNYINMEIRRTTGEVQQCWKREKRRLWRSLFLFGRR